MNDSCHKQKYDSIIRTYVQIFYGVWNNQLQSSLKAIKMRYLIYSRSAPTEKDSEKVSYEIPSETQSQHPPLSMDSIDMKNLPTYNLLTHISNSIYQHTLCK